MSAHGEDDDREELQALSLSQLFARALSAASDANDLPTNSDVTQVGALPASAAEHPPRC